MKSTGMTLEELVSEAREAALEDVLTPMLAEAVAEAKRRGDAAVNENREVESA